MFYNKEIQIYTYGSKDDEHGITRTGYSLMVTEEPIMVDIQPYSSAQAKKDYGYDIKTTKRIFMDIMLKLTESAVIKYREQFYDVQKIVEWDDYLDVMLLEKKEINVIEVNNSE